VITPIYFFLHYIASPIELFRSSEVRLTNLQYSRYIFLSIWLGYYIPQLLIRWSYIADNYPRSFKVCLFFPVLVAVIQKSLAKLSLNTWRHDRISAPRRDLWALDLTVKAATTIAAFTTLGTKALSTASWVDLLLPTLAPLDYTLTMSAAILWLGLLSIDLHTAGMAPGCWKLGVLCLVCTVTLGPGTAIGIGWLWREHTLATKRHKAAVLVDDHEDFKTQYGVK
jgi:hypothetical protein